MIVFDPQALRKIGNDLKDLAFARALAEKYRRLLPSRVQRITAALDEADFVTAMDATLSLKVASTTVGTRELAELATLIETDVRREDAGAARALASRLPEAADRADAALAEYLAPA